VSPDEGAGGERADEDAGGERVDEAADLRRRVVEQFSYAGERAAVWRGFDRFLPTGEYLNLGYTPWYRPVVVGDSQARLGARLADGLAARVGDSSRARGGDPGGARLLDVGCGRGGPARQFAARGFAVTGVDLVPYNVSLARANAGDGPGSPAFVVGDATALPVADGAVDACAAVDALVYLPDERAAFREIARVLAPGGWFVTADLLAAPDAGPGAEAALAAFADAWDMAVPVPADAYRDRLRDAGLTVETAEDITANSTARFRKWSRAFLALADGPGGGALRRLLGWWGVEPEPAIAQVRAAHRALPSLRHEVVYARR